MSDVKPPLTLGILLALLGAAFIAGGINFMTLGGNAYFLVIGFGIFPSGALIAMGKRIGAYLYAATLLVIVVWSFIEARTDMEQLLTRIAVPSAIGAYIFFSKNPFSAHLISSLASPTGRSSVAAATKLGRSRVTAIEVEDFTGDAGG